MRQKSVPQSLQTKDASQRPNLHRKFDFGYTGATEAELKEASLENLPEGYIAGWASTPALDHAGDVVVPNAFALSISERGLTGPRGVKLLIQHDRNKPAGVIHKLETRGNRLWMEAQLNLDIGYVKDFYAATKMIGGMSFSVGFHIKDWAWQVIAGTQKEYLEIREADLVEVSLVTFPCNEEAEMTFVKTADEPMEFNTLAEFEKALVAQGVVKSRNMAALITQAVKQNPHLFTRNPAPVADESLSKLGDMLSQFNKSLS